MGFMPKDVFTGCALTTAFAGFSGASMHEISQQLASDYSRSYEDTGLERDILLAGERIMDVIPTLLSREYSNSQLAGVCKSISVALAKYEVDGSKKRRGIFGGTLFNKEKSPISNKVEEAVALAGAYHIAILSGAIDARKL